MHPIRRGGRKGRGSRGRGRGSQGRGRGGRKNPSPRAQSPKWTPRSQSAPSAPSAPTIQRTYIRQMSKLKSIIATTATTSLFKPIIEIILVVGSFKKIIATIATVGWPHNLNLTKMIISSSSNFDGLFIIIYFQSLVAQHRCSKSMTSSAN